MPEALILIADGSEEIEFVTPYDVLTRAGFKVHSAGVNLKEGTYAVCSRNVRIIPDSPAITSVPSDFSSRADVLVIPGGGPGAATMRSNDEVLRLIREFRDSDRYVALICAGTTALVASVKGAEGEGKASAKKVQVTSHPSVKEEIEKAGWEYADESERVVVDEKVITSRGPGTAMLFALTIVEKLFGKKKREEVEGPMICANTL